MQSKLGRRLVMVRKDPLLSYPWGYIIFDEPPVSIEKAARIVGKGDIISVGDVVTKNFCEKKTPKIAIIDTLTRRKNITWWDNTATLLPLPQLRCKNAPGSISSECIEKLRELILQDSGTLIVNGEEDLLALPSLAFCKSGMYVVYGNWKGFLQVIPCTTYFRKIAFSLLKRDFRPG